MDKMDATPKGEGPRVERGVEACVTEKNTDCNESKTCGENNVPVKLPI